MSIIKPCYHGQIKIGDRMVDLTDLELVVETVQNTTKSRVRIAVVDGSLVQPVTDPARLLETNE